MELVFFQPAIIPVLGPRAFEHKTVADPSSPSNNITTACELFICESKRLACFQLRSPLVTGDRLTAFFNEFAEFLKEQQVKQFIILTGMFSHEQHSIGTTKFMYLADERYQKQQKSNFENNDWIKWNESNNTIHGGGFAMKLYKRVTQSIPSCIFFKYTAEGDNRSDAVEIVAQLSLLIDGLLQRPNNGDKIQLTIPISWKAMFGNEPTEQLY